MPKYGECDYHLCRKEGKIYRCKYCGKLFCKEHLKPKPAGAPKFRSTDPKDLLFMEEWHEEDGHPCWPYQNVWEERREEEGKKYDQALDALLKTPKQRFSEDKIINLSQTNEKKEFKQKYEPIIKKKFYQTSCSEEKKGNNFKVFIIIFIIILGVVLWKFGVFSYIKEIIAESLIGNKLFGGLIFSSNEHRAEVNMAFQKLNDIRIQNNLTIFSSDREAYNLAVYLSKQKYLNFTFDNLELDIISWNYLSKNVGFSFVTLLHDINDSAYNSEWDWVALKLMAKEEYKLEILNKDYDSGAIGCYKYECTFVGFKEKTIYQTYTSGNAVLESNTENNKKERMLDKIDEVLQEDTGSYKTGPKTIYPGMIRYVVYEGVNNYLASLPRSMTYYNVPPTTKDFIMRNLDNNIQKEFLLPLVERIKDETSDRDAQARIAIDLVQGIPYDWEGFRTGILDGRYPYEVLYDMTGVCAEKSELLAFLLRELGFGVAIFEFESENHRAVGIKCDHGNYLTDYCFIEATDYYPIGQIPYEYVGGVDIRDARPELIVISEGYSYSV